MLKKIKSYLHIDQNMMKLHKENKQEKLPLPDITNEKSRTHK